MTDTDSANALTFFYPTQPLRHLWRDGEPWFVAADICIALGLGNNREALTRLDDDEKGVSSTDTPGGKQEVAIVNESGLYSLILGSRKPEAKRFKKWVTAEVLPAIRRTGRYDGAAQAGSSLVLHGLMAQVGDLQAQIAQGAVQAAAHTASIIDLQGRLIRQQEREIKALRRVDAVQGRLGAREAVHAIIDMERNGQPRALMVLRTGRNSNHIRQVLHKARAAGMLPPLAEGDFPANMPAPERAARVAAAAATAQGQLDLCGVQHG